MYGIYEIFLGITCVLPRSTVASYKQSKSATSVSNNWRHAALNPQGLCVIFVWAIDIDVICERCKRPAEEHRRIAQYTSIVSLFSQAMVDHLKYSLSCERFFKL